MPLPGDADTSTRAACESSSRASSASRRTSSRRVWGGWSLASRGSKGRASKGVASRVVVGPGSAAPGRSASLAGLPVLSATAASSVSDLLAGEYTDERAARAGARPPGPLARREPKAPARSTSRASARRARAKMPRYSPHAAAWRRTTVYTCKVIGSRVTRLSCSAGRLGGGQLTLPRLRRPGCVAESPRLECEALGEAAVGAHGGCDDPQWLRGRLSARRELPA